MRNVCGTRRVDRVRKRCEFELSVLDGIEKNLLKWYGHVERMGEERLLKKAYQAILEGNRGERETTGKMNG